MQNISLSQIYPGWKRSVVIPFYERILQAIDRENYRLQDFSFVVLSYQRELDYDGFTDDIKALDGFTDK